MRSDFEMWPEIVFLDGTYKLTNNDMTMMILMVEDGNGRGQIAGVGLLATEEWDVLEWMLTQFKKDNKNSWTKIKSFMTDKDLTERDVLKQVFPGVSTYICAFHVLKTFKKVVESSDMNLTKNEKMTAMSLLEDLVYAPSEEIYREKYLELNISCPSQLVEYFNQNWNNIKQDWSLYSLIQNNLGNTTNNRLESINGKIKQVIKKNSPLAITIKDFFEWYFSHKTESYIRAGRQFLRRKNIPAGSDIAEHKYVEFLSDYASKRIRKEIKLSKKIFYNYIDEVNKVCKIGNLEVSTTSCQCIENRSYKLPCKHIFAARSYFQLSLFDETLFDKRWIKLNLLSSSYPCLDLSKIATPKPQFSIATKKLNNKKIQSFSEKRKIVNAKYSKLVNIISRSCGSKYEKKLKVLDILMDKFSDDVDVEIVDVNREETLEESFQNLSIDNSLNKSNNNSMESTELSDLNKIKTPRRIKVTGRPSGFLETTVKLKKKVR